MEVMSKSSCRGSGRSQRYGIGVVSKGAAFIVSGPLEFEPTVDESEPAGSDHVVEALLTRRVVAAAALVHRASSRILVRTNISRGSEHVSI